MKFTLQQVADLLKGRVEGDSQATVSQLNKIEEGEAGGLSFLANPQYQPYIYSTRATAVIVSDSFVPEQPITTNLIRVPDAYQAFAELLKMYDQLKQAKNGISSLAFIDPSASLGTDVYVGEFAVIGQHVKIGDKVQIYPQAYIGDNVTIGDHSIIYPGVKIYSDSVLGKACTVHAGTVIGADGFGFAPSNGEYTKVPQIGNVVIEDHVEIGANTCIDRATLGSTIIKKGVKLDNLIQIAHNVVVGENTVMASQVGVSGSTKVGQNCMFGGQVGLAGHIRIADGVKLGAQAGVPGDVRKENAVLLGSPSIEAGNYRRSSAYFKNFEKIVKRIDELERILKEQQNG